MIGCLDGRPAPSSLPQMKAEPHLLEQLDLVCCNMKWLRAESRRQAVGLKRRSPTDEEGLRGWEAVNARERRRPSLMDVARDVASLKHAADVQVDQLD